MYRYVLLSTIVYANYYYINQKSVTKQYREKH